MTGTPRVVVIGLGNELRGDDGAGLFVARRLRLEGLPRTEVVEERVAGPDMVLDRMGIDLTILVDAVRSGALPGTVHRFEGGEIAVPRTAFRSSTHGFGAAEAIRLAGLLGRLPAKLVVFGIEGSRFDAGAPLSPEVERGALSVVDRVAREVTDFVAGEAALRTVGGRRDA